MKWRAILALLVALAVCGIDSAAAPGPAELRSLVDVAPGPAWHGDPPAEYDASTLSHFIDGGAEVYLDYGFVRAVTTDYASGDQTVTCTVYQMVDPEAAFGVFSYFRGGRKAPAAIGDAAFAADLQVAFWQDRYFVTVETFSTDRSAHDVLDAFARSISTRIAAHAAVPAALDRLPAGRVTGSEKLLRGRIASNALYTEWPSSALAFGRDTYLLTARYTIGRSDLTVWMLLFRDGSNLDPAWASLVKLRLDAGCRANDAIRSGDVICQREGSSGIARRAGASIAIVTGSASIKDEAALLDRVLP